MPTLVLVALVSASVSMASELSGSARGGSFCSKPALRVEDPAPLVKARLGIEKKRVKPGGWVRVRIESLGASALSYGLFYELARRKGDGWVRIPPEPVFTPVINVSAGMASECQSIHIPRTAISGYYRIKKVVEPLDAGPRRKVFVRADLQVRG